MSKPQQYPRVPMLARATLLVAMAAMLTQCGGLHSSIEDSSITRTQSMNYDDELAAGVQNFYVQWNAGPAGRQSSPPTMRDGEFLAARYFDYNNKHYAIVRVLDSTAYLCENCTASQWEKQKTGLGGKFAKTAQLPNAGPDAGYKIDDARRMVIYAHRADLYAVMDDNGVWRVHGNPMDLGNEEMLWRKIREEEAKPWK